MSQNDLSATQERPTLFKRACELKRKGDMAQLAGLVGELPRPLDRASLPAADEIAFGLGNLRKTREAVEILEAAFALEPTWRRASALAYLYYDASLLLKRPRGERCDFDKEYLRKGFRRWIEEALRMEPGSMKDLYRLGVFEAQVESRHDVPALRALLSAIDVYQAIPAGERRGDQRKCHTKALFAAGRSALRLGKVALARKLAFGCIREDKDFDDIDPVHKLHLAAKVCLASGELEHAERAARLALDAKGPPRRNYLFSLLAQIELGRGNPQAASQWIESHVRPQHRDAATWRLLGDVRRARGDLAGAVGAYESALQRDRAGRHLTLVRIGEIHLEEKRIGRAKHAFEEALRFRRKHYESDDPRAVAGLKAIAEASPGLAKVEPAVEQAPAATGTGGAS